jgi:hypothetical protein
MNIKTKELQKKHFVSYRKERSGLTVVGRDNFYEIEANLEVIGGAGIRSKVASQR